MESVLRPCPVCRSESRTILFHQTFSAFSGKNLLSGYKVVTCNVCGCGFADGIPSQADFDSYYRDLSKYEYQHRDGVESSQDLDRFRAISGTLVPFIPFAEARILEVGCATGRLLGLLKEAGFTNVSGLDPSPSCREAARRVYDVPVRTGSLHDLLEDVSPVDMMILIGVLEHLYDLRPALQSTHRKLSRGGRIYVEVPDVKGFKQYLDAPFQQFSTEHVIYFSPVSLVEALAVEGFRPLLLKQESRPHSRSSTMPVLWGIFEKTEPESEIWGHDSDTRTALESYIEASTRVECDMVQRIDALAEARQPLLVWGVGTLTRRLLANTRLGEANIVAFIDSNPNIQGQSFQGIPVISPGEITGKDEAILIASWVFAEEIEHQLRNELRCRNTVIRLLQTHPAKEMSGITHLDASPGRDQS